MTALRDLYAHFVGRTTQLVSSFNYHCPMRTFHPQEERDTRRWLIIRLHILWGAFCQDLVTKSALGNIITAGGLRLDRVPSVQTVSDVEKVALNGRRFPSWHHPHFTVRAAQSLNLANSLQISTAIGATSPAGDLTSIRNYLAHPSRSTARPYQQLCFKYVGAYAEPADLLSVRQVGGATLFENWVAQFQNNAFSAIQ